MITQRNGTRDNRAVLKKKVCLCVCVCVCVYVCIYILIYDVPAGLIWKEGTPFETKTSHTAPSSDGLLAEVLRGFPQP